MNFCQFSVRHLSGITRSAQGSFVLGLRNCSKLKCQCVFRILFKNKIYKSQILIHISRMNILRFSHLRESRWDLGENIHNFSITLHSWSYMDAGLPRCSSPSCISLFVTWILFYVAPLVLWKGKKWVGTPFGSCKLLCDLILRQFHKLTNAVTCWANQPCRQTPK